MMCPKYVAAAVTVIASTGLYSQTRSYIPSNVTGQLVLTRTVNPQLTVRALGAFASWSPTGRDIPSPHAVSAPGISKAARRRHALRSPFDSEPAGHSLIRFRF